MRDVTPHKRNTYKRRTNRDNDQTVPRLRPHQNVANFVNRIFFFNNQASKQTKMNYYLVMCFCATSVAICNVDASAIPMWEYLSKDEKMSYLYSMFANQVDEYCEFSNMHNCNQELLSHGLTNLKGMPEDHLDSMDPYQRGANNIIWESMMDGHETMKNAVANKAATTTTVRTNVYDEQELPDNGLGSQGAGSARIETVYRVPPPKGFVYPSQYRQQTPPPPQPTQRMPLTGPMVIRVHPDGRPVSEDAANRMPEDEDLKQYKMSQAHIAKF